MPKVTELMNGRGGNSNLPATSDSEGRVCSLSGSKEAECLGWVLASEQHFCKQRRAFYTEAGARAEESALRKECAFGDPEEHGRGKVGGELKVRATIVKSSYAQARMSGFSCLSNRKPFVDHKQESK